MDWGSTRDSTWLVFWIMQSRLSVLGIFLKLLFLSSGCLRIWAFLLKQFFSSLDWEENCETMRRFNSSLLRYDWGLRRIALMGKEWLEWPMLWPCIWNIFSTDGGTRDGNASFTSPYRVIDVAESPAVDKDNVTILFAPKNCSGGLVYAHT